MSDINFSEIMRQMEQQIQVDSEVFGENEEHPQRITVVQPTALYNRPLTKVEEFMLNTIKNIDTYSWERDARGGLDTGFPLFNETIEGGVTSALYLLAAQANVGKSALMLQIGQNISKLNENAYVAYFSLDDSLNELAPRYIACDQLISIAQAKNPKRFEDQPDIIEKRNEGIKNLYRRIDRFGMYDSTTLGGTSVELMEDKIKELKMNLPEGTKIVLMIDSIYDLTVSSKNLQDKALYEHVAKTVKQWTVTYDVAVFATAHLRKLNGGRRPTNDDLKENNRLEYEANFIGLLYNEVGIKEEGAEVYWLSEDEEIKMPVIEMKVGKNKLGSFKGTRFFEFIPDKSHCIESPIETCRRYASLIYQS